MARRGYAARMTATDTTIGVWHSPAGRVEITRHSDHWIAHTYTSPRTRVPAAARRFDTAEQVRRAVAELESSGYTRAYGVTPQPPPSRWANLGRVAIGMAITIAAMLLLGTIIGAGD